MKLKYSVDPVCSACAVILVYVFLCSIPTAFNQELVAAHESTTELESPPSNPKMAYIRTWFMVPASPSVDVALKVGDQPEDTLISNPHSYFYCGYRESAPGGAKIIVFSQTTSRQVRASWEGKLKPNRFYTVLVRPKGSDFSIEVLDDTLDKDASEEQAKPSLTHSRIRLYQFVEDQPVGLSIQALDFSETLQPGDFRDLEVPEPSPVVIRFKLKDSSGTEISGESDANLKETPSISVLLLRDLYGRFSARIIPNGLLD